MLERRAPTRAIVAWIAAVVTAVVLFVGAIVLFGDPGELGIDDGLEPADRLALLQEAVGDEPEPPAGARSLERTGYPGDDISDGPSVEWEYRYTGTPDQFAEHYRRTLPQHGWVEEPPGNMPGQITNFRRERDGEGVLLVIWGPGLTPNFGVSAYRG